MSSMRNVVQRRNHRERAQPRERAKWGILEKHKDYTLRAQDFNAKKARLRSLRQKAADRNPDEFYFGMMSTKMSSKDGTKVGDRGNTALGMDVVRLLKTQDSGYLRVVIQKTRKELEGLEQEVHLLPSSLSSSSVEEARGKNGGAGGRGAGGSKDMMIRVNQDKTNRHIIYVDSREEQRRFVPETWFGTDREGLARTYNRPRITTETQKGDIGRNGRRNEKEADERQEQGGKGEEDEQLKRLEKWKARVEACRTRLKHLERAERELSLQRDRMSKTPMVGGVNKQGVKWKVRERKR